ncbi:GNAT family N-acetyltransferase [Escherichia coli]|uniref:GNAT family N-acetyltransferase n=1 Tax=Escherichia coli TaxID=562 RepID=UPI003594586F
MHEFPELCIFAYDTARPVGVIICRLDRRKTGILRGYIGMLTVDKSYRHKGIGASFTHTHKRAHPSGNHLALID